MSPLPHSAAHVFICSILFRSVSDQSAGHKTGSCQHTEDELWTELPQLSPAWSACVSISDTALTHGLEQSYMQLGSSCEWQKPAMQTRPRLKRKRFLNKSLWFSKVYFLLSGGRRYSNCIEVMKYEWFSLWELCESLSYTVTKIILCTREIEAFLTVDSSSSWSWVGHVGSGAMGALTAPAFILVTFLFAF